MKRLSLSLISFAAVGALAVSPLSAKATALGQTAHTNTRATTAKPTAAPAKPVVDDRTLTDRIDSRLKADARLKPFDVDVSVKDRVVTLTGKVRTQAEKTRAGRDAHVAGVARVDNQLTLDKDAGKNAAEHVKSGTNTAANATRSATDTTVDKTKSAVSKTGEAITDSWITTKVHAGFMGEDLLKGSDINVDTKDHVVTLKGTVKTDAARARATQIAKSTEGVTRVVDDLKIGSK